MKIEMLFMMETEDDDEPLTMEQWRKEMSEIIKDVKLYMEKKHRTYIRNIDGEYCLEQDGEYEHVGKRVV